LLKEAALNLTPRFEEALIYANQLHSRQVRKGSGVPYVAHLLGVCALVMEFGGDEDQAIAALLHDAIEDQGGDATRQEIRKRFGERVTAIVDGCSDTDQTPKPAWKKRKEAYLAHLQKAPTMVRLVSAADKVHNVRSLTADYRQKGDLLWSRFQGGREGSLWYYRELVQIFWEIGPEGIARELAQAVEELESLMER
jgi:(p)ppGpp synthase/HD superfamily hydrolase